MITTLPGLYYASLLLLPALHLAARTAGPLLHGMGASIPTHSSDDVKLKWVGGALTCSVRELRLTNAFMALLMAAVVHRILDHIHGQPWQPPKESWRHKLRVAVVILFPVQYFFYFLFYTDAVGTLMVLAMYERTLAGRAWMASVCGAVAIVCRQTNVVWVVFCGGVLALRRIEQASPSTLPYRPPQQNSTSCHYNYMLILSLI